MSKNSIVLTVFMLLISRFAFGLEFIGVSADGKDFTTQQSGEKFVVWGVNYDHDFDGRLLEDYWIDEWDTVAGDFAEMKAMGANVVRVHLQTAKFMKTATEADAVSLAQLAKLVKLAEDTGLYLDITGLGCYHKQDVPAWYDAMNETERWDVQALFWGEVAKVCSQSPAIFCYDLMNEPVLSGKKGDNEWLVSKSLGGKYFVQRITKNLAGRSSKEVAKLWVDKLVASIRAHDDKHMITVGVIPWAITWPKAKPLFYSPEVSENLDFVSVHFYPEKGKIDKALKALAVYDIGKPLVVEEMFILKSDFDGMDAFIEGSRDICDGWIGFYWGTSVEEYATKPWTFTDSIIKKWLKYFKKKAPEMTGNEAVISN